MAGTSGIIGSSNTAKNLQNLQIRKRVGGSHNPNKTAQGISDGAQSMALGQLEQIQQIMDIQHNERDGRDGLEGGKGFNLQEFVSPFRTNSKRSRVPKSQGFRGASGYVGGRHQTEYGEELGVNPHEGMDMGFRSIPVENYPNELTSHQYGPGSYEEQGRGIVSRSNGYLGDARSMGGYMGNSGVGTGSKKKPKAKATSVKKQKVLTKEIMSLDQEISEISKVLNSQLGWNGGYQGGPPEEDTDG